MSFVYSHPFTGLANGLNTMQGGGAVGGWVELGRTTLGSAGDTITVSSLSDKRYYMILTNILPVTNSVDYKWILNNDTGTNYSRRRNLDGGTDGTDVSQSNVFPLGIAASKPAFGVNYISNLSSKEKLSIEHTVDQQTAGAATAPRRGEHVAKWANTSSAINRYDQKNANSGDYDTGSEVVVLGWDPDDTHTNNFWEELASVDLSGGAADNLSSGTITAKKYLWIQYYVQASGSAGANFQFNNDTGSNYAHRRQDNGTSDATATSQTDIEMRVSYGDSFGNMFIINNASNEKLVIAHEIDNPTAGAATAPQRTERVAKWTNTSNQITEIDLNNDGGGDFDTGTIMKVWGAD